MRQLAIIAAAFTATAINYPLPGTCSAWVPQTNGFKWRMCASPQKVLYCEMKRGRTITRIQCP
jgi:hypothetical protein